MIKDPLCPVELYRKLEAERKENKILKEALSFYADLNNYSPEYLRQSTLGRHGKLVMFIDGGKLARQALNEIGESEQ
jgi:hypothetical protein